MMSSDSEYEEEEFYVFADFANQLLPREINNFPIKIIGVESAEPIAEINGNIFKGTHDFAVGTMAFFEKDREITENVEDTLFEAPCKQKYNFLAKTNKVINFQRIYIDQRVKDLEENANKEEDKSKICESKHQTEESKINSLKVNMTYNDAIGQFPTSNEENQ